MRRHRSTARLASLLVLAAVLASGIVGQATDVASAIGDATARSQSLVPASRAPARALPPAGVWRPVTQDEAPSTDCDVRGIVESPTEGGTVPAGPLTITGWAADISAADGTGIDEVRVSLDADPDQGGVPVSASYGGDRSDIAELLGDPRFTATGFVLAWDSTSTTPGPHVLYVQVHGACGWTGTARSVVVAGSAQTTSPATAATTTVPAGTSAATTPSSTPTNGSLVFPTVPLVTPTGSPTPSGSPSATAGVGTASPASAAGQPTVPLTTATLAPSPTGSIPAPTNVTASINPMDGSVTLQWTAPAAMVTSYLVVVNEPDGSQRPIRDAPGSATRVPLTGLDPRIGYSLSVVPIDAFGRRGSPSSPVSTAGAPTATPIPTPTLSPYCTPVPFGPPICPPPGFNPAAYPGGAYPGAACPPGGVSGPYGVPGPYGQAGPYGVPGQFGPTGPYGAPAPYGFAQQGCYGQPAGYPGATYPGGTYPGGVSGVGGCGAAGQACATRSTATPSVPSAPAATGMQINVTVLDLNGQPVVGAPVTVTPSSGNGQANTPTVTSGPGGLATVFVRGTGPGAATFTITVGGQPLPAPITVTFT